MTIQELFEIEPTLEDNPFLEKIVEVLSGQETGELFFVYSNPFFIRYGKILQKIDLFSEEETFGSLEEDQKEVLAELMSIFKEKKTFTHAGVISDVLEFSFEMDKKKVRVRIESCKEKESIFVTIKLFKQFPYALKGLGFTDKIVSRLLSLSRGLIIITGPPASGKTTTALSLVHEIASYRSVIAYTYERPVEVPLSSSRSIIVQKSYGFDFDSWTKLQAERKSPASVVYIADIGEREAAEVALDFAVAGKLVIITITGESTFSTLQNLESLFLAEERALRRGQLAFAFQTIIYQNLIRSQSANHPFTLAYEVIFASDKIKNLIAEGKYNLITPDTQPGSVDVTYKASLYSLLHNQRITKRTYELELTKYYKGYTPIGGRE